MIKILVKLINWLQRFLSGSFVNRKNTWQRFPEFFEAAIESSYPIPGLKKTRSLNLSKEQAICQSMTPQGLTLTENFLLMSAYCHDHLHHSVINVLDRQTGVKIKTIILPDLPHVGGLAYDPTHKKIWVSNIAGRNAAVATISLSEIEAYSEKSAPIQYQEKIVLSDLPRASALTYDHGYLVVALFSQIELGKIAVYPINNQGQLEGSEIRKGDAFHKSPYNILTIPPKIQGVTFYKDYLLLSQSWGRKAGKIFIFDIPRTTDFSDLKQAKKIITTPPYLEQIYVKEDQLFALFESGAEAYRKNTRFVMKEVMQLDINKLLK